MACTPRDESIDCNLMQPVYFNCATPEVLHDSPFEKSHCGGASLASFRCCRVSACFKPVTGSYNKSAKCIVKTTL